MHTQLRSLAAILLLTACASLDPAGTTSKAPSSDAEVVSAIEASERARKEAARAGDPEKAVRYIDPDFFFVHSTGHVDDLERFRAYAERVGRLAEPRLVGEPTYAIAGETAVRTQLRAAPPRANLPDAHIRSLDVFVHRDGMWKWLAHQSTMVRPPWAEVSIAPALLEEYAGTYVNDSGPSRSYRVDNAKLIQTAQRGGENVTLTAISESTFALGEGSTTVTFLRNRSGRVEIAQTSGPLGISVFRRSAN